MVKGLLYHLEMKARIHIGLACMRKKLLKSFETVNLSFLNLHTISNTIQNPLLVASTLQYKSVQTEKHLMSKIYMKP